MKTFSKLEKKNYKNMYNLKKKLYLNIFLYCLVKKKKLKKRLVGEERKKEEEEKAPPNWFSVEKNIMFAPYISNSHRAYEN